MATKEGIDIGVLNPETTEIHPLSGSHYVYLRDPSRAGGLFPYPPEGLQRRNNEFAAALALVIRPGSLIPPDDVVRCLTEPEPVVCDTDFFEALRRLRSCLHAPDNLLRALEVLLLKIKRPFAPGGYEWNAPGGVVRLRHAGADCLAEVSEECRGLRVWAHIPLGAKQYQYASGGYREHYSLFAVLATGEPALTEEARNEGIVGWTAVPLAEALRWIRCSNLGSPPAEIDDGLVPGTPHCWVDGKVDHALRLLIPELWNLVEPDSLLRALRR